MDTSTTGFLPRQAAWLDKVERCVLRAVLCAVEQHLGFVPAWAVLGDYLDGAARKAARVGVHVIATLASRANHRG